jgi:SAM-dependent methyltransferase
MNDAIRNFSHRVLSPRAFCFTSDLYWLGRHYLPGKMASIFVHKAPVVLGYPSSESNLAEEIRATNVSFPTPLCSVMTWHGSDKGHVVHNYTKVYSTLFANLKNHPIKVFELGLGSNNPNVTCNMGEFGRPGASLRGWREFFPQALIYGADVDRGILFRSERIETFYCDQLDADAIRELWSEPALQDGIDILIEDGLHTFEANVSFLKGSLRQLRPGGIYVVEDINKKFFPQWRLFLTETAPKYAPEFEFVLTELPNEFNQADNNLLFVRRAG